MVRLLLLVLLVGVGLYALLVLLMYAWQDRLVYQPVPDVHVTPADTGLPFENATLATEDGEHLHAWWIPTPQERAVALFCHGNAGNVSGRLPTLQALHRLGLSTLIFDYRGYGRSTGRPTEDGLYRDAEAAWQHLTATRGIDPERIVVFGRSLGSGPATWLAERHAPAALVLEAAFTSIPDVAAHHYPLLPARTFVRTHFPNRTRLSGLRLPVLIIHSRDDEIIPYAHGRTLYETASEPKFFLETHGLHGAALFVDEARYLDALDRLLREGVPAG